MPKELVDEFAPAASRERGDEASENGSVIDLRELTATPRGAAGLTGPGATSRSSTRLRRALVATDVVALRSE